MSNRKENLKKSLGITEYPWSSDDEENETETSVFGRAVNDSTLNTNFTNVSSRVPSSPACHLRRYTTWSERKQFWSSLNNPNRITTPTSTQSAFYMPPQEMRRPITNTQAIDINRILAFKRLTNGCGHDNARSPSSLSTTPMNLTLNIGRFKRRDPSHLSLPVLSRPTFSGILDSGWSAEEPQASSSLRAAPPNSDLVIGDDDVQVPVNIGNSEDGDNEEDVEQAVSPATVGEGVDGVQENVEVYTSGGGLPLGEEMEESEADNEEFEQEHEENTSADNSGDIANDSLNTAYIFVEEPKEVTASSSRQAQTNSVIMKRKHESEDESSEQYSVKEFNQCLLRMLECPVCLEWMEPPMSQCRRGHLVCGRCRSRLTACPVCRTAFSSVRNRAMEGVAEMLRYPCRHGCGREFRLRRRGAHEASCEARRYRCPVAACAQRNPLSLPDLHHHFQIKHATIFKEGRRHEFSLSLNVDRHDTWLVATARELFQLHVTVDIRVSGISVYVAYIGPKCNAHSFVYEVTAFGQQNERKMIYSRVTHSDVESSSLSVSRQDCFHLIPDQALNFLRQKNRTREPTKLLNFVVEINKRENALISE